MAAFTLLWKALYLKKVRIAAVDRPVSDRGEKQ